MDNCREMTVREYIESMKDYDEEKVERMLELYDREREEKTLGYCRLEARLRKEISGVDYDDGRVTGVEISGILDVDNDEPVTAFFRREVPGRWILRKTGDIDWEQYYTCSNCGDKEYWESNFCPKCGAKMDGGGGNSDMA